VNMCARLVLCSLLGSLFCSAVSAQEAQSGWKFSAMPYIWLSGVKAAGVGHELK